MRTWTGALHPGRLASLGLVVACAQPVDQRQSLPSSTQYELRFPSTAVAVATETVQVMVFDASVTGADCLSLATARVSGAQLPQSPVLLLDTGSVPICSLAGGQSTFELSFGARSFLGVAQKGGQDFFYGCTQTDLQPDAGTIDIWLAEARIGTTVPETACTSLSQKCGPGGC